MSEVYRPISRVLVANRGEIARRVFRTCRDLGLDTVAVFADPDADSPHVEDGDWAVRLPGAAPADTYLRGDLLIDAALAAGADAIHPGYGFLSENADFARAVVAAGLTWIGPPAEAIAAMGSKIESKKLMAAAGVPVLPELDPDSISAADLPVLLKASAGGGGRGMRVVHAMGELAGQLQAARSEAGRAFGDPTVFCEPYLPTGHHIEVQVMADRHGTVWAIGERECSIQRRHQKVIEEAPSPLVARIDGMRERLFDAATLATEALSYLGAGTVEFLADDEGGFHFLEMNTRLQVEHPVTECTTGIDLVQLQLLVAAGGALPPERPVANGHAIEARLYAEDPAADWRPHTGTLQLFDLDARTTFECPATAGIRVDAGVRTGSVVGADYDPMLAKVISWAPDRQLAARMLARGLRTARLHGVQTNRDLLVRVLGRPAFVSGDTDTSFFDQHDLATLAAPLATPETQILAVVAATAAASAVNRAGARVLSGLPGGWRNVWSQPQSVSYRIGEQEHTVRYRQTRDGLRLQDLPDLQVVSFTPKEVSIEVRGVVHRCAVARYGDQVHVDTAGGSVHLHQLPRFLDPSHALRPGSLVAPMPGTVVRVAVARGDRVDAGQPLLWLEAMKMEHQVVAPVDGHVVLLSVAAGQHVDLGDVLAVVGPNPPEEQA